MPSTHIIKFYLLGWLLRLSGSSEPRTSAMGAAPVEALITGLAQTIHHNAEYKQREEIANRNKCVINHAGKHRP